jgi:predicted glycogen debranching enzyme
MNDAATLKQIKRVGKRVAKSLSKPVTRMLDLPVIQLDADSLGTFDESHQREWLITNGIGGFAMGTVGGCNTRRYHGLLIASLHPPVDRIAMVSKLDIIAHYAGKSYSLATNEFSDGTIDPQGYRFIESFRMEGQIAIWTWRIGNALLEQRMWMAHGQNTTYVSFNQTRGDSAIQLQVHPLCTYRDYHWQHHGYRDAGLLALDNGFEVNAYPQSHPYRILIENGSYQLNQQWYWNFKHREESARGLDDTEDLFRPAVITLDINMGKSAAIVLTAETESPMQAVQSLQREQERQQELLARATLDEAALAMASPAWIQQLVLAADQFIVDRRDAHNNTLGKTVIAGYPWFSDWGRDTMIALPGLCMATGRYDVAASILRTFSKFVSEGMLPNRFPDGGEVPEYNTVDATLWYFIAIHRYLNSTDDQALRSELYPVLKDIIEWHLRGTRYNIHMDQTDGLLFSGEPGVQLTWMDAKVGDWVVTPRTGKCVEINALWFNALCIMKAIANQEQDAHAAQRYATLAELVANSFTERFWFEQGGYLFDVIDDPNITIDANGERRDASLRPNQIFAISLPFPLLDNGRARRVVELCARELWTPVGMRSLAVTDPRYVTNYRGGPLQRDGAYHQGTVWSWLLGPFIEAHLRVYADTNVARNYIDGMAVHLRAACVGQVSEIFDGDAPFTPRGCVAQAWGVAEILRIWSDINER